jgi:divalent metal cation (Fe/Co/Zn/Cd) transporter
MDLAHAHLLSHELEQRIAERLPGYTVTLHMEPSERCEGAQGTPDRSR